MEQNIFVCFCIRIICPMCTIFNTKQSIINLNKINQHEHIRRTFIGTGVCTDRQTECMDIFQFC